VPRFGGRNEIGGARGAGDRGAFQVPLDGEPRDTARPASQQAAQGLAHGPYPRPIRKAVLAASQFSDHLRDAQARQSNCAPGLKFVTAARRASHPCRRGIYAEDPSGGSGFNRTAGARGVSGFFVSF
jgi:hypothetical protein